MATLGVDLGGTEIKAVALGEDGAMLWRGHRATGAAEGRDAVLGRLAAIVDEARAALAPLSLEGAGFAVPGVIDTETGVVELLTNFTRDWDGFNVGRAIGESTGVPAVLINDVRAATLGEALFGAGKPYRHFACVAIGTGIGGGLVLNGELYSGGRGAAGEIGHQTLQPDGPSCNCGNTGCLEALASGRAIARDAAEAIRNGDSQLERLAGSPAPTPAAVARAALAGSEGARRIYERAGRWIGLALANVVCILNPDAIVVGGGVAAAGELLLAPLRDELARRTIVFAPHRGGVPVLASPLGTDAGALGAAARAAQMAPEAALS
jgi:glucokinase